MKKIYYPNNYFFTSEHEWVKIVSDELVYVGLTEFGIRELDTIEAIEIYGLDKTLQKNQVLGRIVDKKYSTKLIMPVKGTVTEVNYEYSSDPEVIDEQYGHDHWIISIRPSLPIDMSNLLSLDEYEELKIKNSFHLIQYVNKSN